MQTKSVARTNWVLLLATPLTVVFVCCILKFGFRNDQLLNELFFWCVVAGFTAQLIDGALGMGYGIVSDRKSVV